MPSSPSFQKHLLPPLLLPEAKPADRIALVKFLTKLIAKLPSVTRDRLLTALSFGLSAIVQQLRTVDASLDLSEIEKVLNLKQLQSSAEAAVTSKLRHQHLNRSDSSSPPSSCTPSPSSSATSPHPPPSSAEAQQQPNGTKEDSVGSTADASSVVTAMVTE